MGHTMLSVICASDKTPLTIGMGNAEMHPLLISLANIDAGVRMLGYFLVTVFFVIASGIIVSKTGYYTPWLILGTALLTVGCGLLTTFQVNTSTAKSIGIQVSDLS